MAATNSEIIAAIFSIKKQSEFTLGEEYENNKKYKNGLGTLYKAKFNDEERQEQLLCRAIQFKRIKSYVIDEIYREAFALK